MAASATSSDDDIITGINVTPLVDVVLVLLVILMVTAGYVASRGLPLDLPRAATAEAVPKTVTIAIDKDGKTFLDGVSASPFELQHRVRAVASADRETRALIAADGRTPHADVVRVIDLLRRENLTHFSLNVDPAELAR